MVQKLLCLLSQIVIKVSVFFCCVMCVGNFFFMVRDLRGLRAFENWEMFGCKIEKLTKKSRKLHSEDLHDLYSSPNKCRRTGGSVQRSCQLYLLYSSVSLNSLSSTVLLFSAPLFLYSCGNYLHQFYSPVVLNFICSTVRQF